MKRKVDYEKAWKELYDEVEIQTTFPVIRPEFEVHVRVHKWTLKKMDEILKQCTKPQKKKSKESEFEKVARLKREQVDFSDPNF